MGRWTIHREMYFLIPNCIFSHFSVSNIGLHFTADAILELFDSVSFLVTPKIMVYLTVSLNHRFGESLLISQLLISAVKK